MKYIAHKHFVATNCSTFFVSFFFAFAFGLLFHVIICLFFSSVLCHDFCLFFHLYEILVLAAYKTSFGFLFIFSLGNGLFVFFDSFLTNHSKSKCVPNESETSCQKCNDTIRHALTLRQFIYMISVLFMRPRTVESLSQQQQQWQ